jgi:hypothetical protein
VLIALVSSQEVMPKDHAAGNARLPLGLTVEQAGTALRIELMLAAALIATFVASCGVMLLFCVVLLSGGEGDPRKVSIVGFLVFLLTSSLLPTISILALARFLPAFFERWQLSRISRGRLSSATSVAPFAHVGAFAVIGSALLAYPIGIFVAASRGDATVLIGALGVLLIIFGLVYHRIPNSRRSVKYGSFLIGSQSISAALLLDMNPPGDVRFFLWFFAPLVWITVYTVFRYRLRPTLPLARGDRATWRVIRWHRWAMAIGPGHGIASLAWMMVRLIPLLGDCYWAVRICSKERLARSPVLYLRSFSSKESASLLADVVAPALVRTCALTSLVHPSQTNAALQSRVHPAWGASAFAVSDAQWQAWYVAQLETALAVIVDASDLSLSTAWELETAAAMLGPTRVAVLLPESSSPPAVNCTVLRYAPSRQWLAAEATKWIDGVLVEQFGEAS